MKALCNLDVGKTYEQISLDTQFPGLASHFLINKV